MRAVLQRVSEASVTVDGILYGRIDRGWLVLLGVAQGDTDEDAKRLATKIVGLRGFADADGKMNLDVLQAGGRVLVISQFTLLADCRKGRRPSFVDAAQPEEAMRLYQRFIAEMTSAGLEVASGSFGADMKVALVNDGPVTFLLDTRVL